jgi:putative sigma-54 modulation protein
MRLQIVGRGVAIGAELQQYIERRVGFAFSRFATRIQSVMVRLWDANGPRGGVDQRCDVEVAIGGQPRLLIRERHQNLYGAAALALERAERTVARQVTLARPPRRAVSKVN